MNPKRSSESTASKCHLCPWLKGSLEKAQLVEVGKHLFLVSEWPCNVRGSVHLAAFLVGGGTSPWDCHLLMALLPMDSLIADPIELE